MRIVSETRLRTTEDWQSEKLTDCGTIHTGGPFGDHWTMAVQNSYAVHPIAGLIAFLHRRKLWQTNVKIFLFTNSRGNYSRLNLHEQIVEFGDHASPQNIAYPAVIVSTILYRKQSLLFFKGFGATKEHSGFRPWKLYLDQVYLKVSSKAYHQP